MITIFTPTYNRKYIIHNLYNSLLKQTNKNFEWLIVDDGSNDNTKELIESYMKENKIKIRYYYQENGGKMRAVNYGVKLAEGEHFFIVDSDDYLTEDACEQIERYFNNLPKDFAVVSFNRIIKNPIIVPKYPQQLILDVSPNEYRKLCPQVDRAEVIRTEVIKKYPFPEIEDEKFVSEIYLWKKVAREYKFRYVHYGIYVTEYIEDGYSKNIDKVLKANPKGMLWIKQLEYEEEKNKIKKSKILFKIIRRSIRLRYFDVLFECVKEKK